MTTSTERALSDLLDEDSVVMVVFAVRWMARRTAMPMATRIQITRTILATKVPADVLIGQDALLEIAHRVLLEHVKRDRLGLLE